MARVELLMPKMGESIIEATILNWVKKVGDMVEEDETILEIATDKVDSEIPSPVQGKITEILFEVDAVVPVGTVIAILDAEGEHDSPAPEPQENTPSSTPSPQPVAEAPADVPSPVAAVQSIVDKGVQSAVPATITSSGSRFYSPLVKSIAKAENISQAELDQIPGTGANGRVNKKDIQAYVANKASGKSSSTISHAQQSTAVQSNGVAAVPKAATSVSGQDEIIEMGRMRKLIADHMVMSKQTSPHVTSFVEVDVTNIVNWRNKIKKSYLEKYGEKITFTPIFMEAAARTLTEFPMINVSVEGADKIKIKKDINIGMATALPSGNLIVPVIKNANHLSLNGLATSVNSLASKARANKLKPEDIQGGTFTLTNVGTFGNVMGTPIINQPQVAIMAVGAIRKKPAVVETEYGDLIAVRHLMFCSMSYDHRVVDGFLGGSFLRKFGDHLEAFDPNRQI